MHCQKRDFEAKKCSVLSKILIGFSENPLELGEIGGDFRTRIFTAFSMRTGAKSLENTAFSGFSHLPLSSVKFRQVRFSPLDSKNLFLYTWATTRLWTWTAESFTLFRHGMMKMRMIKMPL